MNIFLYLFFFRPVSTAAAIMHLEQIVDLSWGAVDIKIILTLEFTFIRIKLGLLDEIV